MIKPVSYAEILNNPNWPTLLREYAEECATRELGRPNPQPELYELLEKSGGFQAFAVYDGEKLIGFAVVLIYVLPHFGIKVATSESIFVSASYPGVTPGLLMVTIHEFARKNGCKEFIYSAPKGSRFDRRLSQSNRARHTNNVYLVKL